MEEAGQLIQLAKEYALRGDYSMAKRVLNAQAVLHPNLPLTLQGMRQFVLMLFPEPHPEDDDGRRPGSCDSPRL